MSAEISNKKKMAWSARAIDKMKIGDVVKEVGYLYLTKVIIDLRSEVKKNIQGARNLKGQLEARRTICLCNYR